MKPETLNRLKIKFIKLAQISSVNDSKNGYVYVFDDSSSDSVFDDYELNKNIVKTIVSIDDFPADRHKVSAFFIFSILKNRPIKLKLNKQGIDKDQIEMIANLNLALLFVNHLMRDFYFEKYEKDLKIVPPTTDGNKSYVEQLYTLLIKLYEEVEYKKCNKVLLLTISHILYLVEKNSICTEEKQ